MSESLFGAPALYWNAKLNMTKVELELIEFLTFLRDIVKPTTNI